MKKKMISKLIGIGVISSSFMLPTFAAEPVTVQNQIQYSPAEEFALSNNAELLSKGIQVIGGDSFEIDVVDKKTRAKYTVYVDWDIGYTDDSNIGLVSYTRAYSTNLNCLLKRIDGTFEWDDPNSSAYGLYSVNTSNTVPTYQVSNAIETRKTFSSGKKLDCTLDVDIDAISEISGGTFYATDTVTIP